MYLEKIRSSKEIRGGEIGGGAFKEMKDGSLRK